MEIKLNQPINSVEDFINASFELCDKLLKEARTEIKNNNLYKGNSLLGYVEGIIDARNILINLPKEK